MACPAKAMAYDVQARRVYDSVEATDGSRFLVDRVWPRGIRRDRLALTDWLRAPTPSTRLRQRWHRGELGFDAFARAYREELQTGPGVCTPLLQAARAGRVTLLSAVRDLERSHVPVLRAFVIEQLTLEDREAGEFECSSSPCYAEQFFGPDHGG